MKWHISIYLWSSVAYSKGAGCAVKYLIRAYKGEDLIKEEVYETKLDYATRVNSFIRAAIDAFSRLNRGTLKDATIDVYCSEKAQFVMPFIDLPQKAAGGFKRKDGNTMNNAEYWKKLHEFTKYYKVRSNFMAKEDIERELETTSAR